MENASKALIIAGAILISILIIGLGVFIYNQASGTVSKANLSSQEAMAQNNQFTAYFGDKCSAATVKSLCTAVNSNNITSTNADELKYIGLVYIEKSGSSDNSSTSSITGKVNVDLTDPMTISKTVKSKETYNVNVPNSSASDEVITEDTQNTNGSAYYKSGYLRVIVIQKNS